MGHMDKKSPPTNKAQELKIVTDEKPLRLEPKEGGSKGAVKSHRTGVMKDVNLENRAGEQTPDVDVQEINHEEGWGERPKRSTANGWLVLALLAIFGFTLWAIFSVYKAPDEIEEVVEQTDEPEQKTADDIGEIHTMQKALKSTVSEYLAAETVEAKLLHSRHPERVGALMKQFYQNKKIEPEEFLKFGEVSIGAIAGRPFTIAEIKTDRGEKSLAIEQISNERFLVDWETDVYFQPMEWMDFLREKPTDPIAMRVIVSMDHFYAYEFNDEEKYQCYRITDRNKKEHVFGYVERGSKLMQVMNLVFTNYSTPKLPLILKLRFPKEGDVKRGLIIEDCISDRWLYATPPS